MTFITPPDINSAPEATLTMYAKQAGQGKNVPDYARLFGYRPQLMDAWAQLQRTIKKSMDHRQFELATLASSITLKSTNCSLAHAGQLNQYYSQSDIEAIISGEGVSRQVISEKDQLLFDFACEIAADASKVTPEQVDALRQAGFSESDVFDIASVAAARAFFTKLVDGLGSRNDDDYNHLTKSLRERLIVGRPVAIAPELSIDSSAKPWLRYSG